MKEELITFDTAKLLNDKCASGSRMEFNVGLYGDNGDYHEHMAHWLIYNKNLISAPTQSLLQRWIREKYKIHLEITYYKENHYFVCIVNQDGHDVKGTEELQEVMHKTYEEALEVGLQESLKLINK